jgi:nitronate monooxygenase/enoyl-[acyl-carrier protein] reductase II
MTLHTPLCDLLGIEHPVVQGPLGGPWDVSVELVAAVSNAGGLGSIAAAFKEPDQLRDEIRRCALLTQGRPFAVNHTRRPFDEEAFAVTLEEQPPVVSLALGEPGDVVQRAHDAGSLVVLQVTTVGQAVRAAEAGVDVIVAQGAEAGGFSGGIGTLALVPQVVDAVAPVPVLAAGGIADGRGLAAALVLGAQGVNVGTRFLGSTEAAIAQTWKRAIVEAQSEDAVKVGFADELVPPPSEGGWLTVPRALRTAFIDRWSDEPDETAALRAEFAEAMRSGRAHDYLPLTGQSAGLIHEVIPAAEIVGRLIGEAEAALTFASGAGAGVPR